MDLLYKALKYKVLHNILVPADSSPVSYSVAGSSVDCWKGHGTRNLWPFAIFLHVSVH